MATCSTSMNLLRSSAGAIRGATRSYHCVSGFHRGVSPCHALPRPTSAIPSCRQLHSLPDLPTNLQDSKSCQPLFSETTTRLLWEDWQGGLLSKLNDEVRGTQWENSSIAETVIGTARDPHNIMAFNYASLALNNSFFLSGLKPKSLPAGTTTWEDSAAPKPNRKLLERIEEEFESLPAFKLAFSSAAYGMSGSGFVWLVQDRHGYLGIVPTYGAGTLLAQNRIQRNGALHSWTAASNVDQVHEEKTPHKSTSSAKSSPGTPRHFSSSALSSAGVSLSRSFKRDDESSVDSRGEELYPLLCVSVHERDWLPDYGMWGKEEYLMRFWECVDWDRVWRLHEAYSF